MKYYEVKICAKIPDVGFNGESSSVEIDQAASLVAEAINSYCGKHFGEKVEEFANDWWFFCDDKVSIEISEVGKEASFLINKENLHEFVIIHKSTLKLKEQFVEKFKNSVVEVKGKKYKLVEAE